MLTCFRYAKWRAAHLHNCIKTGETPNEPAPKPDEPNDSYNFEDDETGFPTNEVIINIIYIFIQI